MPAPTMNTSTRSVRPPSLMPSPSHSLDAGSKRADRGYEPSMPDATRHDAGPMRLADRAMEAAEDVVYVLVGVLLVASAFLALGAIGYELVTGLDDGTIDAVTAAVDGLLLVFILVELVGAVRATVAERRLVAEPFLIIGIIVSIKEIVFASLKAGSLEGESFEDSMLMIGVLGFVVLLLAASSFLVRRKEREPTEG